MSERTGDTTHPEYRWTDDEPGHTRGGNAEKAAERARPRRACWADGTGTSTGNGGMAKG